MGGFSEPFDLTPCTQTCIVIFINPISITTVGETIILLPAEFVALLTHKELNSL